LGAADHARIDEAIGEFLDVENRGNLRRRRLGDQLRVIMY
jgi:hypothetical protein